MATTKRRWELTALVGACVLAASSAVVAIDSYSLSVGQGSSNTDMFRVEGQWKWEKMWFTGGTWHLAGLWNLGFAYWDGDNNRSGHDSLTELSITPVFRVEPDNASGRLGIMPYVEVGIAGPRLLSHTSIGDHELSTALQFGSHLGIGTRIGSKQSYDLGYRFQHISNAGIKHPNDGMNFHLIYLGYSY